MKPVTTWVLLIDENLARIAVNYGPHTALKMLPKYTTTAAQAREYSEFLSHATRTSRQTLLALAEKPSGAHDMAADKPAEPRRFAEYIANKLLLHHDLKKYDNLMLCAPPAMLSLLHQQLPACLKRIISGEVSKNLTYLSEEKLVRQLDTLFNFDLL